MNRAVSDEGGAEGDSSLEQYLRVKILQYLDKSGHLASVATTGNRYKNDVLERAFQKGANNLPSFNYLMELDLFEIANESGKTCTVGCRKWHSHQHLS